MVLHAYLKGSYSAGYFWFQVYREIKLVAVMLMTSSNIRAPELKTTAGHSYWNDKAAF